MALTTAQRRRQRIKDNVYKNPRPRKADTHESLLRSLATRYDFGAQMNRRLRDMLLKTKAPSMDPLAHPPAFLGNHTEGGRLLPRPRTVDRSDVGSTVECDHIRLGCAHGFNVHLAHYLHPNRKDFREVVLFVGCRHFYTEAAAREWWRDNRNPEGEPRPHAAALLDYIAAICKHKGWPW